MIPKRMMLWAVCAVLCLGGDRKTPSGHASNDTVELRATLHCDRDSVNKLLGSDLGGYVVVVDLEVTPKGGKPLAVSRDDFLLHSYKDGQRSRPFAPSQIAGRGALVVSTTGSSRGMMVEDRGPVWGGYPGSRPQRIGGEGTSMGNTSEGSAQATVGASGKDKDDPLLAVLKEKVLPEKETSEPVGGLLYFLMEGKHKAKQLELQYTGPAGKLSIQFPH